VYIYFKGSMSGNRLRGDGGMMGLWGRRVEFGEGGEKRRASVIVVFLFLWGASAIIVESFL
jgi:hypothetical protein